MGTKKMKRWKELRNQGRGNQDGMNNSVLVVGL